MTGLPHAESSKAGTLTVLWCGEHDAVKAARVKDPDIELIPCKESGCREYRGEEPFCRHMFRSRKKRR
jgi:hypothetical protein